LRKLKNEYQTPNIFADGELDENSVCRNFRHTATNGKITHEIAKTFAEKECFRQGF
jgi:hypothetical protein